VQNRYRRSLLVGLVLLAAAAGDAKRAPATSDASEICPAVVSREYEPNRVPVTTGLLSAVTFSSDRAQLPSTGGGSGRRAMDICRIKADRNLSWRGKAAARVEVRPGDNPLTLGVKTAWSGTQGYGGDVNGRSDVLWDGSAARVTRVAAVEQQASGTTPPQRHSPAAIVGAVHYSRLISYHSTPTKSIGINS
jgi:hypothetical protein